MFTVDLDPHRVPNSHVHIYLNACSDVSIRCHRFELHTCTTNWLSLSRLFYWCLGCVSIYKVYVALTWSISLLPAPPQSLSDKSSRCYHSLISEAFFCSSGLGICCKCYDIVLACLHTCTCTCTYKGTVLMYKAWYLRAWACGQLLQWICGEGCQNKRGGMFKSAWASVKWRAWTIHGKVSGSYYGMALLGCGTVCTRMCSWSVLHKQV